MSKNKAVKLHCILYLVSLSWAVWVPCTSRIRFLLKMMLYPGQTTMLVSKNYSRETKHCHASLVDRHFVGCLETPRGLSFVGVWVFETPRGLSFEGSEFSRHPGVWVLWGLSFRDTQGSEFCRGLRSEFSRSEFSRHPHFVDLNAKWNKNERSKNI